MIRHVPLALLALAVPLVPSPHAAAAPRLAVLTPSAPWSARCAAPGKSRDEKLEERCTVLETLADEVRAGALAALDGRDVDVMTRENTAQLLKEMGAGATCSEGECEVETAKLIGADYVVSGNVVLVEKTWLVTLKLHEVRTAKLLRTSDKVKGRTQMEIIDALRAVAEAMVRAGLRLAPAHAASASTQPPPPAPRLASPAPPAPAAPPPQTTAEASPVIPPPGGYPTRPITMIVPFAAGGPTDVMARIVADGMSRALGQHIVIENVPGAGGTTGIARAAQAVPDGYTIAMGHLGTHGAAPALYRDSLRYDPLKDFEPVGMAAGMPILVVARKDFPARDLREFVEHVRKSSGRLSEAHAGPGSVSFTTCSLFNSLVGAKPTRVSYRGTGPALNDLVSMQVDYMCDQIVNLVPQVQADTVKAYAVALPERSPALPGVPTAKEGGLPEYRVSAWNALFAPKATPRDAIAKLNAALVKALGDEGTRRRLRELGADLSNQEAVTPEGLRRYVQSEVSRWNEVLGVVVR